MRRRSIPLRGFKAAFYDSRLSQNHVFGINQSFPWVFRSGGVGSQRVTHPFAARYPLLNTSLDLHVLGTPPAFILSQDRTLLSFNLGQNYSDYQFSSYKTLTGLCVFKWY